MSAAPTASSEARTAVRSTEVFQYAASTASSEAPNAVRSTEVTQ
jgi:hypothetical protein